MGSLYLNGLTKDQRTELELHLWEQQGGKCFIAGKAIDLGLHEIDIDHIIPLRDSGKDDPTNFALTLRHFNRSKQAADLRVARVLARFEAIRETADSDDRGANLNDIIRAFGGANDLLRARFELGAVTYVDEAAEKTSVPLHTDGLSGMRYFFAVLPISVLYHDDKINPRAIGPSIRGLIEEFHRRRPQLHIALGWLDSSEIPAMRVRIFDGQHKAAAQILLGATRLPVRVFVDPDQDALLQANTNAGTTLRQVAFDKSVQRRLGSAMLRDRIARFIREKALPDDYQGFSEKELVEFFRGEQRQVTRYILDGVRDAITHSEQNGLRDFIEHAGKSTDKPFSYSTIEKTFYSQFIGQKMLATPWNYRQEEGENPRSIEIDQICRLISLIAERFYIDQYDEERGTKRIENDVQNGRDVPEPHLRAFRMAKEEILHCWIGYIQTLLRCSLPQPGSP